MDNREIIAQVLTRILMSTRLSQVRNITAAHENTWREALNGSNASQLAADNKLKEVIKSAMAELNDDAVNYVLNSFK
ncbi:hypothetical protein ENKO_553 [Klebsiella phage fENko-Kae01]|nr:hypothetical protein CPT_Munch_027 [Salmonella phage Munch]WNV47134.1 hypothetical protein [Klebsiella phage fENko-Kae01]WNV47649.1 hypothetical protein [Klebsiella phage fENko-Kae01]